MIEDINKLRLKNYTKLASYKARLKARKTEAETSPLIEFLQKHAEESEKHRLEAIQARQEMFEETRAQIKELVSGLTGAIADSKVEMPEQIDYSGDFAKLNDSLSQLDTNVEVDLDPVIKAVQESKTEINFDTSDIIEKLTDIDKKLKQAPQSQAAEDFIPYRRVIERSPGNFAFDDVTTSGAPGGGGGSGGSGSVTFPATQETDSKQYATRVLANPGNTNILYAGMAEVGSATSSAVWRIQRLTKTSNSDEITVEYADGDENFDNVYDNRESLSYS